MNNKTIVITGTTGYLGHELAQRAVQAGYSVVSLGRRKPAILGLHGHLEWSFKQKPVEFPDGIDALVHCAWNMNISNSMLNDRENVQGTERLFDKAMAMGVKKLVFISSTSAFSEAVTVYGRSKYQLEKRLSERGVMIVRPGLIHGIPDGSMFLALSKIVKLLPVVPVFGANKVFFTVNLTDLANAIIKLVENPNLYDAGHPVFASKTSEKFIDVLRYLAQKQKRKRFFFPIPWQPVYWGLKGLERLGVEPPFKSDSLLSLMTLPSYQPVSKNFEFASLKYYDNK